MAIEPKSRKIRKRPRPFPNTPPYKRKFEKLQKDYEELQSRHNDLETKQALMVEYLGMAKRNLRGGFSILGDLEKLLRP